MSIKIFSFIQRFMKGFFASGIVSVLAVLNSGATITNVEDLKKFGVALGIAFFTGGLLAVEKMLTWTE